MVAAKIPSIIAVWGSASRLGDNNIQGGRVCEKKALGLRSPLRDFIDLRQIRLAL
jgi:hypothetical protein